METHAEDETQAKVRRRDLVLLFIKLHKRASALGAALLVWLLVWGFWPLPAAPPLRQREPAHDKWIV